MAKAKFSNPMEIFSNWGALDDLLYDCTIRFTVDSEYDTDTGYLTCSIPRSSISVSETKFAGSKSTNPGFVDTLIATWKFTENERYVVHGRPNYDNENINYVKNQIFSDFPGASSNCIVGWYAKNNWSSHGQIDFPDSNLRKTFYVPGLVEDNDFTVINGITRFIDDGHMGVNDQVVNQVQNAVINFDVLHPWLDYYPWAIRKSSKWESCNRYGVGKRTGADIIRNASFSTDINDINEARNLFNNFTGKPELQSSFIRKGNKWERADLIGEDTGE